MMSLKFSGFLTPPIPLTNDVICTLCHGGTLERFRVLASGRVCGRAGGKQSFSKHPLRHKVHGPFSCIYARYKEKTKYCHQD